MKSKITTSMRNVLKYALLSLPLLLFTFCQNLGEDIVFIDQVKVTSESKVVSLMIKAVESSTNQKSAKITNTNQCTEFLYPMTFDVFFGDDPQPTVITINSDDELIAFLSTLTSNTGFYIHFPIILIDVDGVETVINDLTEFEGTLQMLVDACQGGGGDDDNDDNDDSDNDDSDDDDNDDSDDDDSDDDDSDDDDSDDDDSDDDDSDDDDSDDNDDSDDDDSDDDNDDSDDDDEYDYCHSNNKKVYICHKGQTICVSINAIWGHIAQHPEDYLGQCE